MNDSDYGSSEEDEILDNTIVYLLQQYTAEQSLATRFNSRRPASVCGGANLVHSWLTDHPSVIYEQTRLKTRTFCMLRDILVEGGYYVESYQTRVGIEESLGMFLYMMASDQRIRHMCNQFKYSPETITRQTTKVLEALYKFSRNVIAPRNVAIVHPTIRHNPKFYPYFKDCVGAIDGTHISASVPICEQDAYRNRHGDISQNVMAACDHDMRFVFVYSGWEGSAHDALIFERAINDPDLGFPMPSTTKYYVVDSAYKNLPGFLAPFRGHRYHLTEFSGRSGEHRNYQELFNHRHSSIRNVIERVFGVLKKRFPFLCGPMRNFKMEKQVKFVICCCVVHNFIRETDPGDDYFAQLNDVDICERYVQDIPDAIQWERVDQTREGIENWNAFRLAIAQAMWNSEHTPC